MYNVVYQYTDSNELLVGNRYVVSYWGKENFEKYDHSKVDRALVKVLVKDVTKEVATQLCSNVSLMKRVATAYNNSLVGGQFMEAIFQMQLQNVCAATKIFPVEVALAGFKFFFEKTGKKLKEIPSLY